jgi:hypothetical protein
MTRFGMFRLALMPVAIDATVVPRVSVAKTVTTVLSVPRAIAVKTVLDAVAAKIVASVYTATGQ